MIIAATMLIPDSSTHLQTEDLDEDDKKLPDVVKFLKTLRNIRCTYTMHATHDQYHFDSLRSSLNILLYLRCFDAHSHHLNLHSFGISFVWVPHVFGQASNSARLTNKSLRRCSWHASSVRFCRCAHRARCKNPAQSDSSLTRPFRITTPRRRIAITRSPQRESGWFWTCWSNFANLHLQFAMYMLLTIVQFALPLQMFQLSISDKAPARSLRCGCVALQHLQTWRGRHMNSSTQNRLLFERAWNTWTNACLTCIVLCRTKCFSCAVRLCDQHCCSCSITVFDMSAIVCKPFHVCQASLSQCFAKTGGRSAQSGQLLTVQIHFGKRWKLLRLRLWFFGPNGLMQTIAVWFPRRQISKRESAIKWPMKSQWTCSRFALCGITLFLSSDLQLMALPRTNSSSTSRTGQELSL